MQVLAGWATPADRVVAANVDAAPASQTAVNPIVSAATEQK